jgi:hypothetical protein
MPEFTVKEVRLPELHLPEIKRDDIVRSLSGVRLPDVDLSRARAAKIKVPAVTLTGADVGRLVAAGAAVARFVRPAPRRSRLLRLPVGRSARTPSIRLLQPRKRRSRWPLLIVLAGGAAVAIWAMLRRPAVRERVDSIARDVRERIATMQAPVEELDVDSDEPMVPRAVERVSTEADPTVGDTDTLASDPADGDSIPAFEEAGKPI